MIRVITVVASLFCLSIGLVRAEGEPLKVFILVGQSNMVGWGDSAKLPDHLQTGNDRVLMGEGGEWQPLKPIKKAG